MGKYYNQLKSLNMEMINGYNIRLANYTEGVEAMKSINSIIQRASRLRGKKHFCYSFVSIMSMSQWDKSLPT